MASFGKTFEIRSLDEWAVVVEGEANGDGAERRVFEIRGGSELRGLSNTSRKAMLGAVAQFGGSLVPESEDERSEIDHHLLQSVGAAGAETASSLLEAASLLGAGRRLKLKQVRPLHEAVTGIMRAMIAGAVKSGASPRQLEERAQVALDVCQVLFSGSGRQLDALIDALKPVGAEGDPSEIDLREAEARARLRLKAMYLKVADESLTVAQLREDFKLSRQRLKQLRDEDRLFAIDTPYQKGMVYPTWQFDLAGRPKQSMQRLVRTARDANLDALGLHLLMTGRREGGRNGVQLLDEGREDLVLAMLRGADR